MNYPEALAYLGASRRFGMKLGLEPMRQLAAGLGHPEEKLRFLHLAGTNGKGSTAAFCESILRAGGCRVGLYTSPHLVSVRERIQIDRISISEADFAAGMAFVKTAIEGSSEAASTFFEIMTGLALWYFAREGVDWVVWETGLGGRLDATNIVRPEVCIITHIGLEHQQYLGSTLSEIAAEKAGIIKKGVPVISAVEDEAAARIVAEAARGSGSKMTQIPKDFPVENIGWRAARQWARLGGEEFSLGLMGQHQVQNAACAVGALRQSTGVDASIHTIRDGLEATVWPGRFEVWSEAPLIVLDGAHNPAGARSLVETWNAFLAARGGSHSPTRARLVFASVVDKDITEMARLLQPMATEVSLVRLGSERGAEVATMARHFPGLPHTFYSSVAEAYEAVMHAPADVPILVTGSLFLVGEMLAQRQGNTGEYLLNERLGKVATR